MKPEGWITILMIFSFSFGIGVGVCHAVPGVWESLVTACALISITCFIGLWHIASKRKDEP